MLATLCASCGASAQKPAETIVLNTPDPTRGKSVMEALSLRQSTREFAETELSLQDLSDLLWAANGINRPESGKRTAPSAMNRQDIKVYACLPDGCYLYDHKAHALARVSDADARPDKNAPLALILVADANETWSALDAGIVSQNISIFCAGVSLATYPRASMNHGELKNALKLSGSQTLMLCHPIGYFK